MKKSFYILVVMLCCLFFVDCRVVEEPIKSEVPWDLYSWPEPYPDSDIFSDDWLTYEQRSVLMEMRITKLEITVDRLDRENKILTTELGEQREWSKFWKRLTKILMKGMNHGESKNQKIEEG